MRLLLGVLLRFTLITAIVNRPKSTTTEYPPTYLSNPGRVFTVHCNAIIRVEYLGCFADCFTAVCLRMLDDPQIYTLYETNSVDNCIMICWENGYPAAAVAKGYECMCSNTVPEGILRGVITPNNESACSMPCSGDKRVACGDRRRAQIYHLL